MELDSNDKSIMQKYSFYLQYVLKNQSNENVAFLSEDQIIKIFIIYLV